MRGRLCGENAGQHRPPLPTVNNGHRPRAAPCPPRAEPRRASATLTMATGRAAAARETQAHAGTPRARRGLRENERQCTAGFHFRGAAPTSDLSPQCAAFAIGYVATAREGKSEAVHWFGGAESSLSLVGLDSPPRSSTANSRAASRSTILRGVRAAVPSMVAARYRRGPVPPHCSLRPSPFPPCLPSPPGAPSAPRSPQAPEGGVCAMCSQRRLCNVPGVPRQLALLAEEKRSAAQGERWSAATSASAGCPLFSAFGFSSFEDCFQPGQLLMFLSRQTDFHEVAVLNLHGDCALNGRLAARLPCTE